MIRAALAAALTLVAFAMPAYAASAQTASITAAFAFKATGTGPAIKLVGRAACSVTVAAAGTGLVLVPQVSSDDGLTYQTATTIGGGSISAAGTYSGTLNSIAPTDFRVIVTGLTTGPATGTILCGAAANVTILFGSGAPSGACTPPELYLRTDAGATAGAASYDCRGTTWYALSGG